MVVAGPCSMRPTHQAGVAELVDAADSKSAASNGVGVRVSPPAKPRLQHRLSPQTRSQRPAVGWDVARGGSNGARRVPQPQVRNAPQAERRPPRSESLPAGKIQATTKYLASYARMKTGRRLGSDAGRLERSKARTAAAGEERAAGGAATAAERESPRRQNPGYNEVSRLIRPHEDRPSVGIGRGEARTGILSSLVDGHPFTDSAILSG